jgi:hypothetical protein
VPSLIPVYHSSSIADLWPCHTLTGFGSRRLPTVDVGVVSADMIGSEKNLVSLGDAQSMKSQTVT